MTSKRNGGGEPSPHILDPFFHLCLREAAATPALVAEYDRLCGTDLSRRRAPIVQMIDDATGKTEDDVRGFAEWVKRCVYEPLVSRLAAEEPGDA